jgi:uroporphyrinogen-III synthase
MGEKDFGGLRVLALESRREKEIASLIRNAGGQPTVVPVMREVPLDSNQDAFAFAQGLLDSKFDVVVFLTGAGARILFNAVLTRYAKADFFAAFNRTTTIVRGPKPVAVLREFGVTPTIVSPSPSTWREVLASVDSAYPQGLHGLRIAVQEYGAVNEPLLEGLRQRGALVTQVPVYQWALPENLGQMHATIEALLREQFDVVVFLTGIQALHLLQVAEQMHMRDALLDRLRRTVVASIGPSTTEELARQGITPDFQPSQPKMGILISETARAALPLFEAKHVHPSSVPAADSQR